MSHHAIKLNNIEASFETNIIPKIMDNNIISCSFFYMKGEDDKYTDSLTKLIINFKKDSNFILYRIREIII